MKIIKVKKELTRMDKVYRDKKITEIGYENFIKKIALEYYIKNKSK